MKCPKCQFENPLGLRFCNKWCQELAGSAEPFPQALLPWRFHYTLGCVCVWPLSMILRTEVCLWRVDKMKLKKKSLTDYCPFNNCPKKKKNIIFCTKRFFRVIEKYCPLFGYTEEERNKVFKQMKEAGNVDLDDLWRWACYHHKTPRQTISLLEEAMRIGLKKVFKR